MEYNYSEKILVAKVAVENTAYHFDKLYDYAIPRNLAQKAFEGMRVMVPFGIGNKKRQALILFIEEKYIDSRTKYIEAVLDKAPLLSSEMIALICFMKERYYCTYFEAINTILPSGIHVKVNEIYKLVDKINNTQFDELKDSEKEVIDLLRDSKGVLEKSKLIKKIGTDIKESVLEELLRKGLIIKEERAKRNIKDASIKIVSLTEYGENFDGKLTEKQRTVYDLLCTSEYVCVKELCYFLGITVSVIDSLVKKGIAQYSEQEVYRDPYKAISIEADNSDITLNAEQEKAYGELKELYKDNKASVSLLYGVTGSGKTSVFMKLIDDVYNDDKGIILMVPEISLTPQMVNIFKSRYGDSVSVFHSALSIGERLDEWKKVKENKSKIVIGTRSAIFAPFDNLGLIIMDEEHEYSYKSDSKPRFHARDIAKFRCQHNKALLLLSSATPSVESYFFANIGRYSLHKLSKRYSGSELPNVTVVDMNEEVMKGNDSPFSEKLINGIRDSIKNNRQAILLYNRRGYNTFASCKACKEVIVCPNCSISLTYHSANNRLMCHYCGYSVPITDECPHCHEREISYVGFGTQRIEEDIEKYIPNIRVLRMDADTTMAKFSHEKKLRSFENFEYDVMIGTQMVAKGLNFDNVTFVGVLSADQSLYSDDFRSYERTFSLLTQVIGRSGRGKSKGTALIQTFTPESNIIALAARQDYDEFYKSEIAMRKAMLYPPFADICVVGFLGKDENKVIKTSFDFSKRLIEVLKNNHSNLPIKVIGPAVALIAKLSNKYRYKLIIKFRNNREFREMMSNLLREFGKKRDYNGVNIFVDINPDMIM